MAGFITEKMPVKGEGHGKLHSFHHRKTGAVHETEILVVVLGEGVTLSYL